MKASHLAAVNGHGSTVSMDAVDLAEYWDRRVKNYAGRNGIDATAAAFGFEISTVRYVVESNGKGKRAT